MPGMAIEDQLLMYREHLHGHHDGPEDYRSECVGCDRFRLQCELDRGEQGLRERIAAQIEAARPEGGAYFFRWGVLTNVAAAVRAGGGFT